MRALPERGGALQVPLTPPGYGRIAQLVEQLTLNQRVLGSSPSASTTPFTRLPPKAPQRLHYCQALHNFLPRPNDSRRSRVYVDMAGGQYLIETPTTTERTQP